MSSAISICRQIGGERFAQSGNAGILDLVSALEWVREHAARFGGDPGNVTIFGQSGGGGKVSALLAMPRAKGLFHKAIIQSGASVRFAERERTTRLADAVLKHLGLEADQLDALQALPLARLQEAVAPAQATLPRPRHPLLDRYNFGPVIDGSVLPAPAFRSRRALGVGRRADPDRRHQGRVGDLPRTRRCGVEPHHHRGRSAQAHRGRRRRRRPTPCSTYYKRRDPAASPSDRLITALTASNFGVRSILLAERKAARAEAPVWMYRFDWETPAFGGRLKSPHSVEVPFVFDTLQVIGEAHRKPRAQALADRVSKTWATFARNGDPGSDAIPTWPTYTAERRATMLLDDTCKVVNDPDGEVRPLWSKVATG